MRKLTIKKMVSFHFNSFLRFVIHRSKTYYSIFSMNTGFMTVPIPKRQIGNLIIEGVPEIPRQLTERLSQYQSTRQASVVDWLNNGKSLLISTRFGETSQFHIVQTPGGARQQITFFKEPLFSGQVCPNPAKNGFLFSKDIGGSEAYQIFYFDLATGDYRMLTDGESKYSSGLWNGTGKYFAYTKIKKKKKDHHIYLQHIDFPQEEILLFEGKGFWFIIDWSPDNQYLTIGNYISINESYIHILDVKTKKTTPISFSDKIVAYRGGIWSKDGKGIYLTADDDNEFRQLKYYDIAQNKVTTITKDINWDIQQIKLSPKGEQLAFTVNENGIDKLYLLNTSTFEYLQQDFLPEGQIGGLRWHPNGKSLALHINTAQFPSDVYVLHTATQELNRWTYSEVGGLNPESFIAPQLIHYPTFDKIEEKRRLIPAFYYKPDRNEKHPVLIYIHGGPESQYRPGFSSTFQYYIKELGIAVIAPNVRGSVGYGKTYVKLDNGYKREDSVKDIGSLLDWIEMHPELDESRVAVIGGSYGGYMVLASMTHYNHRLNCGINIVGISNFVTFLKNTKSYRRDLRRVKYGDERDPQMREHLERISPTTNAHKITKPMLIAQGLNDPRVPASEAEQMLQAIRKNGGEVWYLLAKDEGHGFRKKSNQDYYTKAVMLFLKKYLLE